MNRQAKIAVITAAVTLGAFLWLSFAVTAHLTDQWDAEVLQAVQTVQVQALTVMMQIASLPGQEYIVYVWLVSVSALLAAKRSCSTGLMVFLIGVTAQGVTSLAKYLIERPRPIDAVFRILERREDYSFPSGHVVLYTSVFGFLFYVAWRDSRPSLWRDLTMACTTILVVVIGPSRMYLGTHWPTDIMGGYLLGSLVLTISVWAYARTWHPRMT